jgi:hypothetical protein
MVIDKTKQPRFAIAVIAVAALMLVAATTEMAITGYVFAYSRNQATSSANDCGNGEIPTNIGCQNTDSQIQGDENSVAMTSRQTFPPVPTCEECFDVLSTEQLNAFLILMAQTFPEFGPDATLEEICDALEALPPANQQIALRQLTQVMQGTGIIDPATITEIIECLEELLGLTDAVQQLEADNTSSLGNSFGFN